MCELAEHLTLYILDRNDINKFYDANPWLNKEVFSAICSLYGYPDNNTLTVVIENYYIDAAYRDVYYNYWAKLHFDWNRYSRRILLFKNAHSENEFYEKEYVSTLNKDFLGTMVVRSSYSNETDHTLGRTLLNPYKMVKYDEKGKTVKPFIYLTTAEYKVHLLGNIYVVPAFPFSSQDGVVMRCAETTVQVLCDYASAISPHYARVLPSDIQEKLKHRVSERILPSHGLYCNDISYLLREFKFSPLIYASSEGFDNIKFLETNDLKKGLISNINTDKNEDIDVKTWDNQHTTDFKDWLHYYVESAVPVLIITAPNQEVNKHAALIIGHGKDRRPLDKCRLFKLGNFPCVDTAEFYESYIIQDDNQIPYVEEKMDEFTRKKDYKLEAYIVPLERHVFLEAGSAVNICDAFIEQQKDLLEEAVKAIIEQAEIQAKEDKENRKSYLNIVNAMNISEDNPITVRYYLVTSAEYKKDRIYNSDNTFEKKFYASTLMPRLSWIAEISTYELYKMGYAFSEVVLDATASNKSKINSVILLRTAHMGAYRFPNESYSDFEKKFKEKHQNDNLSMLFTSFSAFKNKEWEWH